MLWTRWLEQKRCQFYYTIQKDFRLKKNELNVIKRNFPRKENIPIILLMPKLLSQLKRIWICANCGKLATGKLAKYFQWGKQTTASFSFGIWRELARFWKHCVRLCLMKRNGGDNSMPFHLFLPLSLLMISWWEVDSSQNFLRYSSKTKFVSQIWANANSKSKENRLVIANRCSYYLLVFFFFFLHVLTDVNWWKISVGKCWPCVRFRCENCI